MGTLKQTFKKYPDIGTLLPAMGYGTQQAKDLETTINNVECDLVLAATPIDLTELLSIKKPTFRIRYEYKDNSKPTLEEIIKERL